MSGHKSPHQREASILIGDFASPGVALSWGDGRQAMVRGSVSGGRNQVPLFFLTIFKAAQDGQQFNYLEVSRIQDEPLELSGESFITFRFNDGSDPELDRKGDPEVDKHVAEIIPAVIEAVPLPVDHRIGQLIVTEVAENPY